MDITERAQQKAKSIYGEKEIVKDKTYYDFVADVVDTLRYSSDELRSVAWLQYVITLKGVAVTLEELDEFPFSVVNNVRLITKRYDESKVGYYVRLMPDRKLRPLAIATLLNLMKINPVTDIDVKMLHLLISKEIDEISY